MAQPRIAVTGATGALGGRIARRLADRGVAQRLIVRDESRTPKLPGAEIATAAYLDRPALVSALRGIETVFFVSGFESEDRLRHHKAAVDAFVEAGVHRVVYTSFLGTASDATFTFARHHFHTEEYLQAAELSFVALRNSLYAELMPLLVTDGVIRGPAGDGRLAPVSRDDVADVAVELLLDDTHPTVRYDVTGPALLTMHEVAAHLSAVGGRPVRFVNETVQEAYESRAHIDAPEFEVEGWVTSYQAISLGEMEVLSDTVERVAGHPPKSLRQTLESMHRGH